MGSNSVKQHFETAQRTGQLKVSQKRLKEFPHQLREAELQTKIRTLDLSENHFVAIPESIGNFTLLKQLNISSNKLTSLPEALEKCIKLESLNAMNNLIGSVPSCYSNLKQLKQIYLSNNQISEFPSQFAGLTKLDVLDLSRNQITCVPATAKDLFCTELNLNQNQVSSLAEEIAECPKLKTLRLEENCLQVTAIPTKLLKNSVVSTILVEGNLFKSKQFQDLDGYDEYQERNTAMKKKM